MRPEPFQFLAAVAAGLGEGMDALKNIGQFLKGTVIEVFLRFFTELLPQGFLVSLAVQHGADGLLSVSGNDFRNPVADQLLMRCFLRFRISFLL